MVKESIWIKKILYDLGYPCKPIQIHIDNQSAIKLVRNPEFHCRTKHIDIKYHFIREKYNNGDINVIYVSTHNQLADLFTKPLPKEKFENLLANMGLSNI